jgi:hypothetical protein
MSSNNFADIQRLRANLRCLAGQPPYASLLAGPPECDEPIMLRTHQLITGHRFRLIPVDAQGLVYDVIGIRPNGTATRPMLQAKYARKPDLTEVPPHLTLVLFTQLLEREDIDIFYSSEHEYNVRTILHDPENSIYHPPITRDHPSINNVGHINVYYRGINQ